MRRLDTQYIGLRDSKIITRECQVLDKIGMWGEEDQTLSREFIAVRARELISANPFVPVSYLPCLFEKTHF